MSLLEEANGNPYGINSYTFKVKMYLDNENECFEEGDWEVEAYNEQEALECVQDDIEKTLKPLHRFYAGTKFKIKLVKVYEDCYVTDAFEQGMYEE